MVGTFSFIQWQNGVKIIINNSLNKVLKKQWNLFVLMFLSLSFDSTRREQKYEEKLTKKQQLFPSKLYIHN